MRLFPVAKSRPKGLDPVEERATLVEPLLGQKKAEEESTPSSPEDTHGWFSKVFFSWMSPMLAQGSKKPLEFEDLMHVSKRNTSARQQELFRQKWQEHVEGARRRGKKPSLFSVLLSIHGHVLVVSYVLKLFQVFVVYARPIILQDLLMYLDNGKMPGWLAWMLPEAWARAILPATGYILALVLALSTLVQSLLQQNFLYRSQQAAVRTVSSLMSAIFSKSLKLDVKAKTQFESGQIINMIGADTARLYQFIGFNLDSFWSAPLQIVVAIVLLVQLLGGWPLVAGLSVLVVSLPITFVNGKVIGIVQKAKMEAKDTRISILKEAISGIKLVKCMAWEEYFDKRIGEARGHEIAKLFYSLLCYVVIFTVFLGVPLMLILAIFACYILLGNPLTAVIAFPAISILNQLRVPLTQLPDAISRVAEMNVSLKRIQRLLVAEELPTEVVRRQKKFHNIPGAGTQQGGIAAFVENGNFSYGQEGELTLKDISLQVVDGSFIAIGGPVGSGKTSLILALLGEMEHVSGTYHMNGSVSYVAQTAFVLNGTVQENILFGSPYDEELYDQVIDVCCLRSDMNVLKEGDQTEIGESGVNLSGGQKQRISLARAVYRQSDIYIFDDPLSAVDAHVGEHIYKECFLKFLSGKTRILVTHGLQFMQKCDQVIMMKRGSIQERGSYSDLVREGSESNLAELARKYEQDMQTLQGTVATHIPDVLEDSTKVELETLDESMSLLRSLSNDGSVTNSPRSGEVRNITSHRSRFSSKNGQLMTEEGRSKGNVARSVYVNYLNSAGGLPMIIAVSIASVVAAITPIISQWWISDWTDDRFSWTQVEYLDVFAALSLASVLMFMARGLLICWASCNAAKKMHAGVVDALMHAPLSFFHTTPQGRIMNRCSQDMETCDEQAGPMMVNFLNQVTTIIGSLVSIILVSYSFGLLLPPIIWLYWICANYYVASSRELKRISSVYKSPVFKHFTETLSGSVTIRAYGDVDRFVGDHLVYLDEYMRAWWPSMVINRWLSVRLDAIGSMLTLGAVLAILLASDLPLGIVMDTGKAGFAVSQALAVTAFMGFTVMIYGQLEMTAVSVERVLEYCNLGKEPPSVIPDNRPQQGWPSRGTIGLNRYSMAYRVGLPYALYDVSLQIKSKERIGVCGRTGAGKSSIFVALLRLDDYHRGSIIIDGTNIDTIGVKDLRQAISVIPQESILFLGTVRFNIDPAQMYPDYEIWEAIRLVGLQETIDSLPGKLDYTLNEEGSNLSLGQKQLLCVARAILRRSRIVLLDEATASVDVESDQKLQRVLRDVFSNCTVLTIAHRIHTIADSSRILVLEEGSAVEFDAPNKLMANPNSIYRSLVEQSATTSASAD